MKFLIDNFYILANNCEGVLGPKMMDILNMLFTWVQIATPCLVLVLCSVDMVKAVVAQDESAVKKAQNNAIKRVIIGVAIFFVPIIINLLLELAGLSGTCGIE